jgi:hypothetical protein
MTLFPNGKSVLNVNWALVTFHTLSTQNHRLTLLDRCGAVVLDFAI